MLEPALFELKLDYYRLPSGKIAAFFTWKMENKDLIFENNSEFQTSKIEFWARITGVSNKIDGTFNDKLTFSVNQIEIESVAPIGKYQYIKGIVLPAGTYKIRFLMRNLSTSKITMKLLGFTIPNL